MAEILTKRQAIEYSGLDDKTFDNYFRNAGEFDCIKRTKDKGRFLFDKEELSKWKKDLKWRTIELTLEDYTLCLDFALAQHFRGYVLSDWGTARQREFGQKITNWVKGQLAEVAVKKFFKNEFDVDVELDFRIYDEIVPQDIIGVFKKGKIYIPDIGIGIKSSKPKSAFLVLGQNEIELPERRSDIYIFCRPDIPDDHLLRLTRERIIEVVKNQPHFDDYKNDIPKFQNMTCEIAGFCSIKELEKVNSIPGQEFDGTRYVKKSGLLHRRHDEWRALLNRL